MLLVLQLGIVSGTEIEITNWDEGDSYDSGDIIIETESFQNHSDSDTLQVEFVRISEVDGEDSVKKEASDVVDQEYSNSETFTNSFTITQDELSGFEDGDWLMVAGDDWNETIEDAGRITARDKVRIESGVFGGTKLEIKKPNEFKIYERDSELVIEWTSENNYNINQGLTTTLEIKDESGNDWTDTITQGTVDSGSKVDSIQTYDSGEFGGLEDGDWTLTLTDNWDEETVEESVNFEVESEESEPEGTVYLEIIEPAEGEEHNFTDDLVVEWNSTNNYDVEQELQSTDLLFEDEDGLVETVTFSQGFDVGIDEAESSEETVSSGEWQDLEPGTWTLTVEDEWEYDTVSESTSIEVEAEDDDGENGGGDDLLSGEDELSASASSNLSTADIGDEFEFDGSGSLGGIESFNWDFDDGNTDSGETVTHSFEEEGTYTVELEIQGDGATDTDTVTVDVEEGAEQQETEDEEEQDEEETDTTGTSDDTDDSDDSDGDEELIDEESYEEEANETTDGDEDESETGSSDECPDGFAYDEENDVCIESDDESDGSVGALDTVTSPEVAGIPVWLITVLAAFAGLQAYWW